MKEAVETVGESRSALMVLDLQDAFLKVVSQPERLLNRCCFAVKAASLLGLPVVLTEQAPHKMGPVTARLASATAHATIIGKSTFSALKHEGLRTFLRERRVEHLLIAGLETPICVYQTVIDAIREGFQVTLLTDCIDCRRTADAGYIMTYLSRKSECHALPAESVFYGILGTADAPDFRAFTDLVKEYR